MSDCTVIVRYPIHIRFSLSSAGMSYFRDDETGMADRKSVKIKIVLQLNCHESAGCSSVGTQWHSRRIRRVSPAPNGHVAFRI